MDFIEDVQEFHMLDVYSFANMANIVYLIDSSSNLVCLSVENILFAITSSQLKKIVIDFLKDVMSHWQKTDKVTKIDGS